MSSNVSNTNLKTFAELYAAPEAGTNVQTAQQTSISTVNDGAVDNKKTAKGDFITFGEKQISKKKAIIGGAVILAAIAGGIALLAKGKIPYELNKLTEEANELAGEAQKTVNNVMNKFNELINNGKTEATIEGGLVKIADSADKTGQKVMSEFSEDGETLLRKSVFKVFAPQEGAQGPVGYKLDFIEEFIQGTNKKNKLYFDDGKLGQYLKGLEDMDDNSYKVAQKLAFDGDGKIDFYQKGFINLPDDSWKAAKELHFEDGKPAVYYKNSNADKEKIYTQNENGKWEKCKPEKVEQLDDNLDEDILDEDVFEDDFFEDVVEDAAENLDGIVQ